DEPAEQGRTSRIHPEKVRPGDRMVLVDYGAVVAGSERGCPDGGRVVGRGPRVGLASGVRSRRDQVVEARDDVVGTGERGREPGERVAFAALAGHAPQHGVEGSLRRAEPDEHRPVVALRPVRRVTPEDLAELVLVRPGGMGGGGPVVQLDAVRLRATDDALLLAV